MMVRPDQLLTGIAIVATLAASRGIASTARHSTVSARLRLIYRLVAILLGLRLIYGAWQSGLVAALLMLTAAWLPFATLRLAEELVRRHAPPIIKLAALSGSLALSFLPLTLGLVWTAPAVMALAAFQAGMLLCILFLLLRDRRGLALSERQAADMLALALALALPLVLTDFALLFPDLPVRGGTFAALILVLAASRLATGSGRPRMLVADMLIATGGGTIILLPMAMITATQAMTIAACATAMVALVILIERLHLRDDAAGSISRALAAMPADASRDGLLSAHPLLARGQLLHAGQLADFPAQTLAQLAQYRLLSARIGLSDPLLTQATRELLDRHAATHLLRLSVAPPLFLAISANGLADARIDGELEVAARLLETAT
ncbi:hypothetical protein PMI04_001790 [Sphingobium sp. AP49]|uniref:hypothetical protein n=1 Tax=Sphingobium sp. AP49 TaxID=1144307 RepID=UPI00026ED995|nr:hypothetical protein [Sphingobium sp. AP49]WHO39357.1 hypothetical protein PMI04_001790 [Sphingobium sp. AP49]